MNSRRHFLFKLAVSATAPAALGGRLLAQETPPPPAKLEETDPVAVALGYKTDTTKVDAQKYPQHKPEQHCSVCALVAPGAPAGDFLPCTAFQGKLVSSNGWCAAFAKKPDPAEAPKQ